MDTKQILAQRQKTHGDFNTNATVSQACKSLIHTSPSYEEMTDVQKEALEMIFYKVARILGGDPHLEDHWDDIAGYALLAKNNL